MNGRPVVIFLISCILMMAGCQPKPAQKRKSDVNNGQGIVAPETNVAIGNVSARLSSAKAKVVAGSPILLSVAIENSGHEKLSIVRFHETTFVVRDVSGMKVEHTAMIRDYPVPTTDDVVELAFGESFGYQEEIKISKPGMYRITAVVSKGDWSERLGRSLWAGSVRSNTIDVRVE